MRSEIINEDAIVSPDSPEGIDYWCEHFNCTEARLREALGRAGRTIHDVHRYLNDRCHEEAY